MAPIGVVRKHLIPVPHKIGCHACVTEHTVELSASTTSTRQLHPAQAGCKSRAHGAEHTTARGLPTVDKRCTASLHTIVKFEKDKDKHIY